MLLNEKMAINKMVCKQISTKWRIHGACKGQIISLHLEICGNELQPCQQLLFLLSRHFNDKEAFMLSRHSIRVASTLLVLAI